MLQRLSSVIFIIWIISKSYCILSIKKANFTSAKQDCKLKEGVISDWDNLPKNEKADTHFKLSQTNGSRIWISGYTSYSKFVHWEGCFPPLKSQIETSIAGNSIHKCSKFCSVHSTKYFGLKKNDCLCIDTLNGPSPVKDKECLDECPLPFHDSCTTVDKIFVFGYNSELVVDEGTNDASFQCVFVHTDAGNGVRTLKYRTESCFDSANLSGIDGFLCEDQFMQRVNQSKSDFCHWNQSHLLYMCAFSDQHPWNVSRNDCESRGGKLAARPEEISQIVSEEVSTSRKRYWTGIFRTADKTLQRDSADTSQYCLVADTGNGKVTAHNCSDEFDYVCYILHTSSQNRFVKYVVIALVCFVILVGLFLCVKHLIAKRCEGPQADKATIPLTEVPKDT